MRSILLLASSKLYGLVPTSWMKKNKALDWYVSSPNEPFYGLMWLISSIISTNYGLKKALIFKFDFSQYQNQYFIFDSAVHLLFLVQEASARVRRSMINASDVHSLPMQSTDGTKTFHFNISRFIHAHEQSWDCTLHVLWSSDTAWQSRANTSTPKFFTQPINVFHSTYQCKVSTWHFVVLWKVGWLTLSVMNNFFLPNSRKVLPTFKS